RRQCVQAPRHHAERGKILTLILYDIIPNAVRCARGHSHEASCGWDRMRRLRAGEDASPAPGWRRELPPIGHYEPSCQAHGRPPGATARRVAPKGQVRREKRGPRQSAAGRSTMARHEAARVSLERERGHQKTMVAPPGARSPSKTATGLLGASISSIGDNA